MRRVLRSRQSGAAFLEYVIALSILLLVFIAVGILLEFTAIRVARRSVEGVRSDAPCARGVNADDILSDEECF